MTWLALENPQKCYAPYGLRGCIVPWIICWFHRYINRLLAYLNSLFTFFLTCLRPYFFISLLIYFFKNRRIGPFLFQAGCRKMWPNWLLIFVFILCCNIFTDACFLLLHWCSFSLLREESGLAERLRNDVFCFGWDIKPHFLPLLLSLSLCIFLT